MVVGRQFQDAHMCTSEYKFTVLLYMYVPKFTSPGLPSSPGISKYNDRINLKVKVAQKEQNN